MCTFKRLAKPNGPAAGLFIGCIGAIDANELHNAVAAIGRALKKLGLRVR